MTNQTTETKPPSHLIFLVIGEGERGHWTKIGAGWTNRDGKGLLLRFDAFPVSGRTIVREIENAPAPEQS